MICTDPCRIPGSVETFEFTDPAQLKVTVKKIDLLNTNQIKKKQK